MNSRASSAKKPFNRGWKGAVLPRPGSWLRFLADANLTDARAGKFRRAAGASLGPELTGSALSSKWTYIADELEHSTARISDLIKAIKEYSYMDQAPAPGSGYQEQPGKPRSSSCITS